MEGDDFNDLVELGLDDELTINFNEAASYLKTIVTTLENDTLLSLYAYYKQGLEGPCNVPKPSWYDFKAKSKWEAWNALNDMSNDEAKSLYIDLVKKLNPDFNSKGNKVKEGWVTVSTLQNTDDIPSTTLIDFVKQGECDKVANCLKTHTDDLNTLDDDGLGLVHWAADRGSTEIIKLLQSGGADLNLKDCDGQTPLHYASSCGHIESLQFLLANGADMTLHDDEGNDCIAAATDDSVKEFFHNYVSSDSLLL